MKRFSDRFKHSLVSELNVTPLIDLAFTLLIIFMIATPLIEQQLVIDLPKASPDPPTPVKESSIIYISLDSQANLQLNDQPITLTQLREILPLMKKRDPNTTVSLRADANLRYQELVSVLDVIKASGVKLGLATLPQAES